MCGSRHSRCAAGSLAVEANEVAAEAVAVAVAVVLVSRICGCCGCGCGGGAAAAVQSCVRNRSAPERTSHGRMPD